ncbi:MAG: hypothetical protein HYY67_08190 [Thaumarchaeota archaeon]|nr:hypothetical protein [Nitrososphaerota archaeon]
MKKSVLAIAGIITIIAVGSVAYLLISSSTNTPLSDSSSNKVVGNNHANLSDPKKLPANLTEANRPSANVTEPKKESSDSNSTESKNEIIVYIRTVYSDPSGKPARGITVSIAPLNDTNSIVYNLPGPAGVSLAQCIHQVPSGAAIVDNGKAAILPDGRKVSIPECPFKVYTTNTTGWVAIHQASNAKYLLIIASFFVHGTYEIVPIHGNQTIYITMKVPFIKTNYAVVNHGEFLLQKGFLSAGPYLRGGTSAAGLHFTLLKGGSANFTVTFAPDERCLQSQDICRDSDFPLRLDLTPENLFGLEPLPYQSVDITKSKLRILMGAEYLPVTHPHRNLTDASLTISPNPVFLGRNDRINVTVTITAKNDAAYGVYTVSFGETVKSAAGSLPEGVGWQQYCCTGFYLTISPFPVQTDRVFVASQQGSKYLGDSTWLRMNYNGTLYAGSDSGGRQIGWWEVNGTQLLFTLPDMTFRGRIVENASAPAGSSIILDDGSVWSVKQNG